MPGKSFSCRTISTPTSQLHSTKLFLPPKQGGSSNGSNGITLQSTGVGASELGVLSSQCLDRRIPDKQTLIDEIAAWEEDRNANHAKADWQFTTPKVRIRLKAFYTRSN